MRIVFMGTPDFAVPTLDALVAAGHEVVAVYTQPPRPGGRRGREQQLRGGQGSGAVACRRGHGPLDAMLLERRAQALRHCVLEVEAVRESHLRLGRVNVHVHQFRCNVDE